MWGVRERADGTRKGDVVYEQHVVICGAWAMLSFIGGVLIAGFVL